MFRRCFLDLVETLDEARTIMSYDITKVRTEMREE